MNVAVPNQRRIIGFYGPEKQTAIHMEECAELIQAISKMRRSQDIPPDDDTEAYYNLVEEIADVLISIDQLMLIYGIAGTEVQAMVDKKCHRQEKRMHDAIKKNLEG